MQQHRVAACLDFSVWPPWRKVIFWRQQQKKEDISARVPCHRCHGLTEPPLCCANGRWKPMEGTFATASYTGKKNAVFIQWSFGGNLLFVCLFVVLFWTCLKKQDKKKKIDKNMYMRLHSRNITNQIRITKKQEQEEKIFQSYPLFLFTNVRFKSEAEAYNPWFIFSLYLTDIYTRILWRLVWCWISLSGFAVRSACDWLMIGWWCVRCLGGTGKCVVDGEASVQFFLNHSTNHQTLTLHLHWTVNNI